MPSPLPAVPEDTEEEISIEDYELTVEMLSGKKPCELCFKATGSRIKSFHISM